MDGCREGGREGWHHNAGIKSPIKLHGGILIYRLMSYCVTNHSQTVSMNQWKIGGNQRLLQQIGNAVCSRSWLKYWC